MTSALRRIPPHLEVMSNEICQLDSLLVNKAGDSTLQSNKRRKFTDADLARA